MPAYAEAVAIMRSSDSGFLFMVCCIAYATVMMLYLARKYPACGRIMSDVGLFFVPVTTALVNLPLALVTAVITAAARFITLPRMRDPIWLIAALALLLRLPALHTSLWYDESFTSRIVSLPLSLFPGALLSDVHPPLYYMLLWPFGQFGSPLLLRLPSLLLSLYSLWLGRRLVSALGFGQYTANWGALLIAVLPASIYYGTEARSYELMVVLTMWCVLSIIKDRPWQFAAALALLMWTHNVSLIYAAVMIPAALVYHWRRRWLMAALVATAAGAAWMPFLLAQAANIGNGHWTYISPGAVVWPLLNMTVGVIGQEFAAPVVIVVIGMTVVALVKLSEYMVWTGRGLLWSAVVFGIPLVEAVVSFLWASIYVHRHFLPSMTLLVIVGWASVLSRYRLARVMLLPVIIIALFDFYTDTLAFARPDYRGWLATDCAGADLAYATSINAAFILAENSDLPVVVWHGAVDNGQTVDTRNIGLFGFQTGDFPSTGTICLLTIDIPATAQKERDYVSSLLEKNAVTVSEHRLGVWTGYNLILFNRDYRQPSVPTVHSCCTTGRRAQD